MAGKLTTLFCKTASIGKHADGGGLYLHVKKAGKYWRTDYRFEGKRKTATHGTFPKITLVEARARHAIHKEKLAQGIDPNAEKKAQKAKAREAKKEIEGTSEYLFSNIANDWLETTNTAKSWTERHYKDIKQNLKNYILPIFGMRHIDSISASEIIAYLKTIPYIYTAKSTLENIKRIYRHAVNHQLVSHSPAELLKSSELLPAHHGENMRHITDPTLIGKALLAIDRAHTFLPATHAFLRLLPYLFTRPSELRELKWAEINEAGDLITIPPERMKKRRPHLIPLPKQAQEIIQALKLHTGAHSYVFANTSLKGLGKAITEGAGYKVMESIKVDGICLRSLTTFHGWRHTASTLLHNQNYRTEIIETQLAHADKNAVRRTYNHAEYLDERRKMLQEWADYLDELKLKALQVEII